MLQIYYQISKDCSLFNILAMRAAQATQTVKICKKSLFFFFVRPQGDNYLK